MDLEDLYIAFGLYTRKSQTRREHVLIFTGKMELISPPQRFFLTIFTGKKRAYNKKLI